MDKSDVIETLNNLIQTSRDGEEGFRTCAGAVKNAPLKQMFEHAANRCAQAVSELNPKRAASAATPRAAAHFPVLYIVVG